MPSITAKKIRFCYRRSKTQNGKSTIMYISCSYGFLKECKLLFKNKHKKIIRQTNCEGITPFERAFSNGHLPVCQWLISQGALTGSNSQNLNSGTLVKNIFLNPKKNLRDSSVNRYKKFLRLYAWSQNVINEYNSFKFYIVPNSVLNQRSFHHGCYLWMLGRHGPHFNIIFNNLIAGFLGIETEESFCNIQHFLKNIRPLKDRIFIETDKNLILTKKRKRLENRL